MAVDNVTFIFKICLCLFCVGRFSHCINFDINNSIIIEGPRGSYFGYSVGILENKDGIKILVGAPRDNNTALPQISRPGQIYSCQYRKKLCTPITINNAGNVEESVTYHNKKVTFYNDMDDQWLGMALDVEPLNHSSIVVCAPRWTDSYVEIKMKGISHMNGICYLLDGSFINPPKFLPALTNLKRLINRKNYVEFSMGGMGFSAVYSKENGTLLFGAPGLNDWSGGVVIETVSGERNVQYLEPSRHTYQSSFTGYSITSGRFMNRNKQSIAIGAPRAANTGQVLLYSTESTAGPLLVVEGSQIGSYFGASMCAINVNSKQLDHLVIGAPMFVGENPEEGRVFVFKSHGLLGFRKIEVLIGQQKPYSRFGSTLANIGDLNMDGFEDIVAGSPYEDDGRGTVYVYNGYRQGIWGRYAQRIRAKDIDSGIRAFGISFSRPYDVDKNGYLDIAVGAYQSDQTVLLLSSPLINMLETKLEISDVHPVNGCIQHGRIDDDCTHHDLLRGNVVFCLMYNGKGRNIPENIVAEYELVFDATKNGSRLYRYDRRNTLKKERFLKGKYKLSLNKQSCQNTTIYIQYTDETNDDVWIDFKYNIRQQNVFLQQFDGAKVQPEILNIQRTQVILKPSCTNGNICKNDILLEAALSIPEEEKAIYILGESNKLLMTADIQNIGTSKHITIDVNFSTSVSFIKCLTRWENTNIPCDVERENDSMSVTCRVINDLSLSNVENMSVIFQFYIMDDSFQCSEEKFFIKTYSSTRRSNDVMLILPIVTKTNITVISKSTPEEVIVRLENKTDNLVQDVVFSYILYNAGPSSLKTGTIYISYPELPGVLDMKGLNIATSPRDLSKYYCTLQRRGEIDRNLVDKIDKNRDISLICHGGNAYCTYIRCKFNNITARTSATISIKMGLTTKGNKFQKLRHVKLGSTSIFKNKSDLYDWDQIILFSDSSERSEAVIDIYNIDMHYEVRETQIWIMVVSAAGGIAFFLVISLFMFKAGFFRRLENEDLLLKKANWKLRIADSRRLQNGSFNDHSFTRRHGHSINNSVFSNDIDDDETHVLIPFSNGSLTTNEEDMSSVSSDESGYLEPIKTRKQRVYLK